MWYHTSKSSWPNTKWRSVTSSAAPVWRSRQCCYCFNWNLEKRPLDRSWKFRLVTWYVRLGSARVIFIWPSCDRASWYDVHVTVHRDKFLIIKPTRCTNFSNLFLEWNSTCFGQFLCPSSGVFHCTHSNGVCHSGLLTACKQDQDGTPRQRATEPNLP